MRRTGAWLIRYGAWRGWILCQLLTLQLWLSHCVSGYDVEQAGSKAGRHCGPVDRSNCSERQERASCVLGGQEHSGTGYYVFTMGTWPQQATEPTERPRYTPRAGATTTRLRTAQRHAILRVSTYSQSSGRAAAETESRFGWACHGRPATMGGGTTQWNAPRSPQIEVRTQKPSALVTTTTFAPSQPSAECRGARGKQHHGVG